MINDLHLVTEYGLYVWLSFLITISSCLIVYYKTYKTLKKYEKNFAEELNKLSESDRKSLLKSSKVANQIFVSYNKSI